MGQRLSPEEQTQIYERFVKGETYDTIATHTRFSKTTVQAYVRKFAQLPESYIATMPPVVQLKWEEITGKSVSGRGEASLSAALLESHLRRLHLQDLCETIEEWRQQLRAPTPTQAARKEFETLATPSFDAPGWNDRVEAMTLPVEGKLLFEQGLQNGHLKGLELLCDFQHWKQVCATYKAACLELQGKILEATRNAGFPLIERPEVKEGVTLAFPWTIYFSCFAGGSDGASTAFYWEYREELINPGETVLRFGSFGIALIGTGGQEDYIRKHQELMLDFSRRDEVGTIKDLEQRLRRTEDKMDRELEELILRKVLPGECPYCPKVVEKSGDR